MGSQQSVFGEELKCVNCGEFLTVLPITWYIHKGNVCGRCPENLYNDGYRNTALEAMIKFHEIPCRYSKTGCSVMLQYLKVKNHEEYCTYRQYYCPTIPLNCKWKGKRSEIKKHYDDKHLYYILKDDSYLTFNIKEKYEQNIFMESMNKPFLIQMRYDKNNCILYCGLIYLEKPSDGKKYVFQIFLKNGNDEFKRKIENSRYTDCYLIENPELHSINFNKIPLLINLTNSLKFKFVIEEEKE